MNVGRDEMIQEIIDYFNGDQWQETLRLWKTTDEPVYHVHVYSDTCIQYKTLERLMLASMKKHGLEIDRRIDYVGNPGKPTIHSVHPFKEGFAPLTDWFLTYTNDCYLKPTAPERGERGENLLWWGKKYMDEWFSQFTFKCVGYDEEKAIQNWFEKSLQWKQCCYYVPRMRELGIAHMHCNVEINFDPKVLDMFARRYMEKMGWVIANATPCVFKCAYTGQYTGKITYSLAYPQEVFDIAWEFNPDVVIRPSSHYFYQPIDPWFDILPQSDFYDLVNNGDSVDLTDDEFNYIVSQMK